MNQSTNFPERILITLPLSREINYQDLLSLLSPQTSQNTSESISNSYRFDLNTFICQAETLGLSSKHYKFSKIDPDDSFVESDSDESSFSSQDLDLAIQEGFYTVEPCESMNSLKRTRYSCALSEELSDMIKKIEKYFHKRNSQYVTVKAVELFRDVEEYLKKNPDENREMVYKKIEEVSKIKENKIMKQLEIDQCKKEKGFAFTDFIVKLKLLKEEVQKENSKYDQLYDEVEARLITFVDLNNKLANLSSKKKDLIVLEEAKSKYFSAIPVYLKRKSIDCCISDFQTEESEYSTLRAVSSHEISPSEIQNN